MLIPLGTDRPLRRPTLITYALIGVCIAVQVYLDTLERVDHSRWEAVKDLGALEPGRWFHWWELFTYAFKHQGWGHLLGNMVILWVFGPNIEDRLGRWWFLLFYLVGAAWSGGMFIFYTGHGAVGASGAIAACTGAYLVMFPRTQVKVLFLLYLNVFMMSAWWFIGISIAWDVWSQMTGGRLGGGVWGSGGERAVDNVAHLAHYGGYLYGMLVALVLLWLKVIPREPYDLFSIGRQAYRRRAFKEAGLAADQRRKEKWEKAKAGASEGGPETDAIATIRADVVGKLSGGDAAAAARGYKELADRYSHVAGAATLSRRWQYDLANWFYQTKDHDAAAFAYARFLEAYPKDPEAGHIRLLLGMIHARALNDPVRAKMLIAEAMKTLEGGEAEMARRELEALG